jgi:hypothetical protein
MVSIAMLIALLVAAVVYFRKRLASAIGQLKKELRDAGRR